MSGELPNQLNFALLMLRGVFGVFLACHGINKYIGGGRIPGTARWFGSMGFRQPKLQAYAAATTEITAGLLFALGLITPVAAAAMISIMVVAFTASHRKVGFFIFRKGEGWEYVASIAVVAFAVGTTGPGEWSLDHALDIDYSGWNGAIVAGGLGLLAAAGQLALFYRPKPAAT